MRDDKIDKHVVNLTKIEKGTIMYIWWLRTKRVGRKVRTFIKDVIFIVKVYCLILLGSFTKKGRY